MVSPYTQHINRQPRKYNFIKILYHNRLLNFYLKLKILYF